MTNSTEKLKAKIPTAIEEQKEEKKFMFQFVNHEDGQRSKPFVGNWSAVNQVLAERKEGERPTNEDYILLVAVLQGKDTQIPATPLITVKTYMDFFEAEGEPTEETTKEAI